MTVLIENTNVKKYFAKKDNHLFLNEIYWLRKFENYKFFPRIIDIDYKKKIILISHEGEKISNKNKPHNWLKQLKKILFILKKNNCFHSDIKPDNLLVKNGKLTLIDFAQSIKITDLKKDIFYKKRIFFDEYSFNRIGLSIEKNLIHSNDLRVLVVWNEKNNHEIEKKILQNRNILIIDKIKIRKNFYIDNFKDRIFWIDQFYNKKISINTDKLRNNIYVYIIKSIDPVFKSNKMIFTKDKRIVDHKIFLFKKKIRKNQLSTIHISDNFEEAKRNAILFSKSIKNFPAAYFFQTQKIFNSEKDFFKKLNRNKKLKYVVLREKKSKNDDIDVLVNDYFIFKRTSDCHSYKKKNLKFISNAGDPIEDYGIKVANFIRIKDKIIKLDVRFVGDGYFDTRWQKRILDKRISKLYYYTPNNENYIFSLIYHVVYHKGFIDKKYNNILKKKFKLKSINLNKVTKIISNYLSLKEYKITRPLDLTIPVTYQLDNFSIKREFQLVKNQIDTRNFSGANKMIYNIIRFQRVNIYLNKEIFILIILNQFNLIKFKLKNFIFKYFNRNELI